MRIEEIAAETEADYRRAFDDHYPLARQLKPLNLPGTRNSDTRVFFACKVGETHITNEQLAAGRSPFMATTYGGTALRPRPKFDPPALLKTVDHDEALWINLLNSHCGWHVPQSFEFIYTAGMREEPVFTWPVIRDEFPRFEAWFRENQAGLAKLEFGAHRPYETHSVGSPKGTLEVVKSYRRWTLGYPWKSFQMMLNLMGDDRLARWDSIMRHFNVLRFGRTGRWDYARMLSCAGLIDAWPPRPYLEGSMRPATGAARLFVEGYRYGVTPLDRYTVTWMDLATAGLAAVVNANVETLEDAFCNWRKDAELADHVERLMRWGFYRGILTLADLEKMRVVDVRKRLVKEG